MIIECCSQERSFKKFFGLLGQVRGSARISNKGTEVFLLLMSLYYTLRVQ